MENTPKERKQIFGQFYTTNYEYILQGMKIPNNITTIIEPFTGNGDLLNFIDKSRYILECYDIDPKKDYIIKRDTILNPPIYTNKFMLTNPPYLARNKSTNKLLFDKYDVNDLYKCVIKEISTNIVLGGIIIIPLNFWSSIRANDIELRKIFLEKYNVLRLNIFEEQVFEDTTYTVCSFQFELRINNNPNIIEIYIYPSNSNLNVILNETNNYMIGGEIYKLPTKKQYNISRLTKKNKTQSNTNIYVKCIDDNENSKIGLSYVSDDNIYVDETPNQTARTYCTLIIEPSIDLNKQKQLINKTNNYLESQRLKYHSLFLSNYRESKDIARKRISFDLIYSLVEYILDNFDNNILFPETPIINPIKNDVSMIREQVEVLNQPKVKAVVPKKKITNTIFTNTAIDF